jgi:hypothetical protein
VLDALERCKISFELGHARTSADPARAQTGDDLLDFVIEDLGLSENNKAVLVVFRVRSAHRLLQLLGFLSEA